MELETIKVVSPVTEHNPKGYIVINKTDQTDEHEVFVGEEAAVAPAPAPPKSEAPRRGAAKSGASPVAPAPGLVDGQ